MNRTFVSLALSIAAATLPVFGQNTQKLTANKVSEYAFIYTLPSNVFDITVAARKTVSEPGEFALYAKKYLGLDPILDKSVTWTLEGAEIIPAAVADADERYQVQFKSGTTPFVMVTQEGFPVSINDDGYETEAAPATSLRAVAAEPTPLEVPAARQAVTEDMLRSQSSAKRAELAAARIYEIRQQRNDISSGQADGMPGDGQAMKIAIDNLDAQEAALTAMFTGTVKTSTEVRTYRVTPPLDDQPTGHIVFARLSATGGLTDADDLSGQPIYVDFKDISTAELPVNEKGVEKTFPKGGMAYRIPGSARVEVTFDGRTIAGGVFDIAQYGVVFGLEPNIFTDKKTPAYLHFYPMTGAIRELGSLSKQSE